MLDDQVKGGVNSTWVTFQGLTGRGHFPVNNIVDVRDVAEAHVRCLTLEDAANQRFLVINQSFTWQDACKPSSTSNIFTLMREHRRRRRAAHSSARTRRSSRWHSRVRKEARLRYHIRQQSF